MKKIKISVALFAAHTNGDESCRFIRIKNTPNFPHPRETIWDHVDANEKAINLEKSRITQILKDALEKAGYELTFDPTLKELNRLDGAQEIK